MNHHVGGAKSAAKKSSDASAKAGDASWFKSVRTFGRGADGKKDPNAKVNLKRTFSQDRAS